MNTGRLFKDDVGPNFRTLMEYKTFLSTWCRSFMHTMEKNLFFLDALKFSLSPPPREGSSHVMLVKTSMDSESQHTTKITSALADPSFYSSVKMIIQDMHMNGITIFLSISPFLPMLWQCRHQDSLVSAWQEIRTRNQLMKITIARPLETHCREEREYHSDFESECEEDVIYWMFHTIIPLGGYCWDYGSIGLSKFFRNLSVCKIHGSCGTWDRHETCVGRSNISTLVGWMVLRATMLVMRSSPHLRLLRESSPGPGPCVLNGWQDSKRVPPSKQYGFSCMTIQQLESKGRQASG